MQYLHFVKNENKFYIAIEDGKASWVSFLNIVKIVFKTLTNERSHNTNYKICGLEHLICDDVSIVPLYFSYILERTLVIISLCNSLLLHTKYF